jgi:Raf kinase inhibitor-like YbhB/YbcL family protein
MAIALNQSLTVSSTAFGHNEMIPAKYTCSGTDINPALSIANVPAGTKTLALIVDDPDAPNGTFVHWVSWNIPVGDIQENSVPGLQGKNTSGQAKYMGPCPPSGTHRYFFKVYAIDTRLDLQAGANKEALLKAMKGHILASGELIGLFKK